MGPLGAGVADGGVPVVPVPDCGDPPAFSPGFDGVGVGVGAGVPVVVGSGIENSSRLKQRLMYLVRIRLEGIHSQGNQFTRRWTLSEHRA